MEETNTVTPADSGDDRPPLWKQILGAVMGGGLALCLYYGYDYAKPKLTAYLTLPPVEGGRMYDLGAANIAANGLTEDQRKRIASRNVRAAAAIEGTDINIAAVEDHSMDIMWPEAEKAQQKIEEKKNGTPKADTGAMVMDEEEDVQLDEEEDDTDDWESLWSEMKKEDSKSGKKRIARSDAPALPDSGFGALILIAGSAAGGAYARVRRKKRA